MNNPLLMSKRKFTIAGFEECNKVSICDESLAEIVLNRGDLEMYWSILEEIDELLDLKINQSMITYSSRTPSRKDGGNTIIVLRVQ